LGEDLGTLDAASIDPKAINNRGQIVGVSYSASTGYAAAFIWEEGEMRALEGGAESTAFSINERGQVVGSSDIAPSEGHAALWTTH
jgi:probable HAF family extracellular repeat protein